MVEMYRSTALVVDDNFYNRDLCTLALTHVGYHVIEACDGMEAIQLLRDQAVDLLVLDLSMPILSGVEVIKHLNVNPAPSHLTIIVLTANPHMITADVQARADFVMNKPIDIQHFAQLVERLSKSKIN
jgi:two-component system, OmpR family, phosphate regulon response regulator PhoB